MKVKVKRFSLLRCAAVWVAVPASPGFFFCERYEVEHNRYDPKDGELYLRRVKPAETMDANPFRRDGVVGERCQRIEALL